MVSTPDLSSLLPAINEQGYTTEIMPPTDAAPVEQLLVFLNVDYRRRQRYTELVFVPDMEELTILQMFVLLPFEIEQINGVAQVIVSGGRERLLRIELEEEQILALGLTPRDYEGTMSTLCAGCGHDSVTAALISAYFELDVEVRNNSRSQKFVRK